MDRDMERQTDRALTLAEIAIRDAMHAIAIYGDDPPQTYRDAHEAVVKAIALRSVQEMRG